MPFNVIFVIIRSACLYVMYNQNCMYSKPERNKNGRAWRGIQVDISDHIGKGQGFHAFCIVHTYVPPRATPAEKTGLHYKTSRHFSKHSQLTHCSKSLTYMQQRALLTIQRKKHNEKRNEIFLTFVVFLMSTGFK
jgi:hypothetical protein